MIIGNEFICKSNLISVNIAKRTSFLRKITLNTLELILEKNRFNVRYNINLIIAHSIESYLGKPKEVFQRDDTL